ncbi:MAG: hypothetical protein LBU14_00900 [Candidatus Peribacteria bacterium]|nr:hypothetical protein [Candidatus Peribacteria bacterium]
MFSFNKPKKVFQFKSSQIHQNKSQFQAKLAIFAQTFAAQPSLYSSFEIFKSGLGHSGFSLFTSQKLNLSSITSHITNIFDI